MPHKQRFSRSAFGLVQLYTRLRDPAGTAEDPRHGFGEMQPMAPVVASTACSSPLKQVQRHARGDVAVAGFEMEFDFLMDDVAQH
ncbi:hypothetical protein [Variovorax sp. YR216]|uniref:hypothetical protein n=1 Tax=Variovorax sp. YR216 TaxID=1882828 RepID=UPI0015A30396|nr:hypothetical protein [Variovorax sp. YR216]